MSEDISVMLEIDAKDKEITEVEDYIKKEFIENEFIEDTDRIKSTKTMGLGIAILVAVLPVLIAQLLKHHPDAINKFVNLIRTLLGAKKLIKSKKEPEVTINFKMEVHNFYLTDSDIVIQQKVEKMIRKPKKTGA